MSSNSFEYDGVVQQVHALICQGRISESQRLYWENRLLSKPGAIRELHLERPVVPPMPAEPERDPNYVAPQSGGQQLREWAESQPEWGAPNGDPVPPRPEYQRPSTTASGIDVSAVRRLDPRVQNCVAREPDRVRAQQLIEAFSGPDGDLEVEIACSSGPAREDVEMYDMELERWRCDPAVSLAEANRSVARPDSGGPITGDLAQSVRDLETASSLLNSLDAELAKHNPGYKAESYSAFSGTPVLERDATEIDTVEIRAVELLNVGTFETGDGPRTISKQDLISMVNASRDPRVTRPALKLGHGNKLSAGGGIGYISNLRLSKGGTVLVGDLEGVPRRLASLVIGTKTTPAPYRSRSVEYSRRWRGVGGTTHSIVLTGLALLGQDRPANQGLADVLSVYDSAPAPSGAQHVSLTTDTLGGPQQ